MGIEMVGIDHSVAEIDIRMIFSFTKKSTRELFEEIKNVPGIAGCVLLSTCNRMEIYMYGPDEAERDIFRKGQASLMEILALDTKRDVGKYLRFYPCFNPDIISALRSSAAREVAGGKPLAGRLSWRDNLML